MCAEARADPLRFALAWLTTQAAQGKNIKFSLSQVEDARRLPNKIWNATRFALMNLTDYNANPVCRPDRRDPDKAEFDLPERWILSRAQHTSEEINRSLDDSRSPSGAGAVPLHLERHLRLGTSSWPRAPARSQQGGGALEDPGGSVTVLDVAMRLLHPFMPSSPRSSGSSFPKRKGRPRAS